MHSTDKIAILMATYNGEKYICQQIDSILSQTCKDWELYIHDDGSTDNTIAALESYVEKYPNKIHLIDGKSTGGAKYNFFYLFGQDIIIMLYLHSMIISFIIIVKWVEVSNHPLPVYRLIKWNSSCSRPRVPQRSAFSE